MEYGPALEILNGSDLGTLCTCFMQAYSSHKTSAWFRVALDEDKEKVTNEVRIISLAYDSDDGEEIMISGYAIIDVEDHYDFQNPPWREFVAIYCPRTRTGEWYFKTT